MRPALAATVWVISVLGSQGAAAAQQPFNPSEIDASRLQTGIDSLAVFLVQGGDTVPVGFVWDELRVVEADGGRQLLRVYDSAIGPLGERLDTIASAYPSLAPIRQRSLGEGTREYLEFAEGRVTGSIGLSDGGSADVDLELPAIVYSAVSFDLILRAGPLSSGMRTTVPSLIPSTRTVSPLRAEVTGTATIVAEECWKVDADLAGRAVTFWIGKDTRRLCRQVIHIQPGLELLFDEFPQPRAGAVSTPRV